MLVFVGFKAIVGNLPIVDINAAQAMFNRGVANFDDVWNCWTLLTLVVQSWLLPWRDFAMAGVVAMIWWPRMRSLVLRSSLRHA